MDGTDESARRAEALDTAFGLFVRFGYRKTSMDEVARAVGLSRQGLYLWFPSKQALFVATMEHVAARTTASLEAALGDGSLTTEERLVEAFDCYVGNFISAGVTPASVDELFQATARLLGDRLAAFEDAFVDRIASQLEDFADDELSARHLAEILYAVSAGVKYKVPSRELYREHMRRAVRLVCRVRGRAR